MGQCAAVMEKKGNTHRILVRKSLVKLLEPIRNFEKHMRKQQENYPEGKILLSMAHIRN
jgi:hypothetical protein